MIIFLDWRLFQNLSHFKADPSKKNFTEGEAQHG
jgi:hypothetical protein